MRSRVAHAVQKGFSLIEAMVGIAVGMIAVTIIAQTFQVFEVSKSTSTAGSDAQENGLMGMTMIEQDARNAGIGFAESGALECATFYTYLDDGTNPAGPIPNMTIAPVTIVDGGTNGSDTITIRTGTDFLGIIPAYLRDTMPQPSAELDISRTYGFQDGDLVLVSQGGNCTLTQVTQVQSASLKLQHNPSNTPPQYNPSAAYQNTNAWPAYSSGAKVFSLGQMSSRTYSINANNLQVAESTQLGGATTTRTLVSQIVSLQARYGVAPAGSDVVNAWVDATGGWSALDTSEIKRVKAIEVTIVARAPKREPQIVTTTAPAAGVNQLADWQYYRYKTYRTIVPLKNILWANLPA